VVGTQGALRPGMWLLLSIAHLVLELGFGDGS
jgi:hypothetical protein